MQNRDDPYSHGENFGIWALRWSTDGRELLAGTGNDSLYLYDVTTSQVRPGQSADSCAFLSRQRCTVNEVASATGVLHMGALQSHACGRASTVPCYSLLRIQPARLLQVTLQIKGHTDDVNAIAYLDDSNNILISGSDDTLVKVWRRQRHRKCRAMAF